MPLAPGTRLGPYQILAPLGSGGMGEVYRGRDTKLGRDVAIKILPEAFRHDRERLARFEREARTLASLNHPHIAQVYGFEEDGVGALVMELVEGEDLSQRIGGVPVPIDEALAIARQVADALEAAHEHGVIHRDLKPGNIRVRPDGTVKVLDFGLAKAPALEGSQPDLSQSPTVTVEGTRAGVILGTAAYMSPEQARGRVVDRRTDIWAFGCVLFEMLTGRAAFASDTVSDTIARVLEREPAWDRLPKATPPHIRRLLRRCLEKDAKRRLRDIGDARLGIDEPDAVAEAGPSPGGRAARLLPWTGWVVAAGLLAAALAKALPIGAGPEPPIVTRLELSMGANDQRTPSGRISVSVSADGRRLVYTANQQLYLRSLDELTARPIAGSEAVPTPAGARGTTGGATTPNLSPDGQSVIYFQNGQLKRLPLAGGVPVVLCTCDSTYGATWTRADAILFGGRARQGERSGVWRIAPTGGSPELLIPVDPGQIVMRPQLLPGGTSVLFTIVDGEEWDGAEVVVQSLTTGKRKLIVRGVDGRYLASGHLVFGTGGALHAVGFDPNSWAVSGEPVPVLSGVWHQTSAGAWGGFDYTVAENGTLVYVPAEAAAIRRVLVWIDRQGREEPLPTEPRAYQYPRLSPDGRQVVLEMRELQNDVWLWDLSRATLTRLTIGRRSGGPAIWSHDGGSVFYGPQVQGTTNVHVKSIGGSDEVRRLTKSPNQQIVDVVTPDGGQLVFAEADPKNGNDLNLLRLDGSEQPRPLVRTPFNEQNAHVSPDGRWIAYQSDESGRFEVYARPFPRVGDGRWQVSTNGGTRPLWGRDGRELFFLDANRRMTVVAVERGARLTFGPPQGLFETAHLGLEGQQRNFDLSLDGKRFLMVRNLPSPRDVPELVVVQNWFAELRAKAP